MTVRFIDTNILLYAISNDPTEIEKAERAKEILKSRDLALSVQVLQEFYVQATRESRPDPLTHEQAVGLVESFLRFPIRAIDVALTRAAFATAITPGSRTGMPPSSKRPVPSAAPWGCRRI